MREKPSASNRGPGSRDSISRCNAARSGARRPGRAGERDVGAERAVLAGVADRLARPLDLLVEEARPARPAGVAAEADGDDANRAAGREEFRPVGEQAHRAARADSPQGVGQRREPRVGRLAQELERDVQVLLADPRRLRPGRASAPPSRARKRRASSGNSMATNRRTRNPLRSIMVLGDPCSPRRARSDATDRVPRGWGVAATVAPVVLRPGPSRSSGLGVGGECLHRQRPAHQRPARSKISNPKSKIALKSSSPA